MATLLRSDVPGYPCRRGKVRDVYDLGDRLVIVATDRISAFDWVLPTGIPDKGRVLTALTAVLARPSQACRIICSARIWPTWGRPSPHAPPSWSAAHAWCARRRWCRSSASCAATSPARAGRSISRTAPSAASLCRRASPRARGCPKPIFTPATKEESGHDQNISFDEMARSRRASNWRRTLRQRSLDVYRRAADHAASRGIILADTKFEWGRLPGGEIILIDEVLTPDSSRFWPADQYRRGRQSAVVRQAVRARLAGDDRLGQEQPAAGVAGRGRRTHRRQVSRGL